MKPQKILLMAALLSAATVHAQWKPNGATSGNIYYDGGVVGIGAAPIGSSLLELTTATSNKGIEFRQSTNNNWVRFIGSNLTTQAYNPVTLLNDAGIIFGTSNASGVNYGFVIAPHHSTHGGLRINFNGNVGIGVASPSSKLDVNGGLKAGSFVASPTVNDHVLVKSDGDVAYEGGQIFSNSETGSGFKFSSAYCMGTNPSLKIGVVGLNSPNNFLQEYLLLANGKVNINTATPGTSTLNVEGTVGLNGNISLPTNAIGGDANNYINRHNFKITSGNNGFYIALSNSFNVRKVLMQAGHQDPNFAYGLGSITLNPFGGSVGIGTGSDDIHSSHKLDVNGIIHAEEVIVDLTVPGPDYVFEENYDLRSLEETEVFINANKHLPEIPSAKEMEAEGVRLKDMNMLLLKKIEELTLHLIIEHKKNADHTEQIAQQKELLNGQTQQIEEQKELLNALLLRIEKLESK